MLRIWIFLLMGTLVLSCGDDDSPTAPGDELVGTWELVFSSDSNTQIMIEDRKVTVTFKGDGTWEGSLPGPGSEFKIIADEHWDSMTYLAWRSTSRAIRNNSFTHALPCSIEVMDGDINECGKDERGQYYELIGKYDQFVVGWDDLIFEETGNPVTAYTEVDSVEKVTSELRLEYEELRSIQGRAVSGTWSVVGDSLVLTVSPGEETEVWRYDYSIRDDTLTLVEEENATVERYEKES